MAFLLTMVSNIMICLISSIPGLIVSKYLENKGFVRKQSKFWYFVLVIILAVLGSMIAPESHWLLFVITTLLATTFGYHRFELWYSFRSGRWWWLKDK